MTARALAARPGETEKIHFLCGTQSLRQENQVHLLEYDEETGILDKTVYTHPQGEIWHLSAAPFDKDLVCSCYGVVEEGRCQVHSSLYRIGADEGPLQLLTTLKPDGGNCRCSVWHPASLPQLATVSESHLTLWNVGQGEMELQSSLPLDSKSRAAWSHLVWNPHHNCSQVLCCVDTTLKAWDLRTTKVSFSMDQVHGPCVRGIDYNPNKPHHFASCGDDCTVKFWDSRHLQSPLLTRHDHSHWVWSVQFNLFHDQLVLSASSDSQVMLLRVASIASEPLQHLVEEEEEEGARESAADEVIVKYEEHEDSVYNAVWSAADAWIFASLSYDGRLVINHVPQQEKFSILTS